MKKLTLLFAAISLLSISKAQITFEYEYDTIQAPNGAWLYQIGDNYYRYIKFDNYQFTLYNLNHSFDKTITFPTVIGFPNVYIRYITQSLFDTDNLIEFIAYYYDSSQCNGKIKIFNEIGSILFESDSTHGVDIISAGNDGYKMYVRRYQQCPYKYFGLRIYSLPGTLPVGKTEIIGQIDHWQIGASYPNPSNNYTIIDYQLQQDISNGEIVFYNIQGIEVKRFKVDRTFNHLRLSTTDLFSGNILL
ncbi:MAG: hypothetical protein FVQ77_02500 [Cytophagales bacterium]|nr:hypothetical protein [Cytophagales bacterium]